MASYDVYTETLRRLSKDAEKNESGLCAVISGYEEEHFSLNRACEELKAHIEAVLSESFEHSLVSKTIKNSCAVGRSSCRDGKCGS